MKKQVRTVLSSEVSDGVSKMMSFDVDVCIFGAPGKQIAHGDKSLSGYKSTSHFIASFRMAIVKSVACAIKVSRDGSVGFVLIGEEESLLLSYYRQDFA